MHAALRNKSRDALEPTVGSVGMQERDGQKRLGREAVGDRGLPYIPQWAQ